MTTAQYKVEGQKQNMASKYGFQVGVGAKIPFEEKLFFAPSFYYSMKGYKVDFTRFAAPPSLLATNNNTVIHTVETAFLLQFDFGKGPGNLYFKVGPSLDFQLFGREEFNTPTGTIERNMKFSFADYGHFSASMIGQLGYETQNGLFFFAQYSHGLGSINNADLGPEIRHRVAGISIGKYIGKRNRAAGN
jgi:hypothetical protein